MRLQARCFSVAKTGNTQDENEDAVAQSDDDPTDGWWAAVSDGATEASFSAQWATLLARAFAEERPILTPDTLPAWLEPLRQRWNDAVPWSGLAWFAEEKARLGAYATLLGLHVAAAEGERVARRWRAVAVGDACLIVVRGEEVSSFPLSRAEDFGNRPELLASVDGRGSGGDALRVLEGSCVAKDLVILATDAVSRWFLAQHACGARPWEALEALDDDGAFAAWVSAGHAEGSLHNDDATVIRVRVGASP